MTAPVLVPCLVQLRREIDILAPERPRGADGWIGDIEHQQRVSDHNDDEAGAVPIHDADSKHEVHAIDITTFVALAAIVAYLVGRCRSGVETRLRYVIFNRRIYSASWGWTPRTYAGTDPHIGHAHISSSYETVKEADTRPWLKELELLTDADKKFISDTIDAALAGDEGQAAIGRAAGRGVHNQRLGKSDVTIGQAIQNTNNVVSAYGEQAAA
jgi:hypothetical protein